MKKFFKNLKDKLQKKSKQETSEVDEEIQLEELSDEDFVQEESEEEHSASFESEEELPPDFENEDSEDTDQFVFNELKVSDLKKEQNDSPPIPSDEIELEASDTSAQLVENQDKTQEIQVPPEALDFISDTHENEKFENETGQFQTMPKPKLPSKNDKLILFKEKVGTFAKKLFRNLKEHSQVLISKIASSTKKEGASPKFSGSTEWDWDKLFDFFYSPHIRPELHRSFMAICILVSSYGVGKITSLILRGDEKRAKPTTSLTYSQAPAIENLANIKTANIFNAKIDSSDALALGSDKKKPLDDKKICTQSSRPSTLPINIFNTIVLQDTVKSIASVGMRGGKEPVNLREGERFERMAEIGRIERMRVVLKNLQNGECEYIDNPEQKADNRQENPIQIVKGEDGKKILKEFADGNIKSQGNKFTIKKNFRDKMLEDIGLVLTQARAIQMKNPDGSMAFKMVEITPGSIYSHLNIQEEDVITKINGKEITNLNEIMTMFGQLKQLDNLSLTVKREGNEMDLEYAFE